MTKILRNLYLSYGRFAKGFSFVILSMDNIPLTSTLQVYITISVSIELHGKESRNLEYETLPHNPIPSDSMILGQNQEQGGSEMQAGARSILTPSPLLHALSTVRGRAVAQTMITLVNNPLSINFTAGRLRFLQTMLMNAVQNHAQPVITLPACGYSPLGIWLAEDMPHATVIEIDIPEVMRRRQRRLRRANIPLPQNLLTRPANLAQTPLSQVIAPYKPDVVDFTGAYYNPDELTRIARYLRSILAEKGTCVCYLPWAESIKVIKSGMRYFKDQIGETPGTISDVETPIRIFTNAGYSTVEVVFPSQIGPQIADRYDLKMPVLDVEVLVVARK